MYTYRISGQRVVEELSPDYNSTSDLQKWFPSHLEKSSTLIDIISTAIEAGDLIILPTHLENVVEFYNQFCLALQDNAESSSRAYLGVEAFFFKNKAIDTVSPVIGIRKMGQFPLDLRLGCLAYWDSNTILVTIKFNHEIYHAGFFNGEMFFSRNVRDPQTVVSLFITSLEIQGVPSSNTDVSVLLNRLGEALGAKINDEGELDLTHHNLIREISVSNNPANQVGGVDPFNGPLVKKLVVFTLNALETAVIWGYVIGRYERYRSPILRAIRTQTSLQPLLQYGTSTSYNNIFEEYLVLDNFDIKYFSLFAKLFNDQVSNFLNYDNILFNYNQTPYSSVDYQISKVYYSPIIRNKDNLSLIILKGSINGYEFYLRIRTGDMLEFMLIFSKDEPFVLDLTAYNLLDITDIKKRHESSSLSYRNIVFDTLKRDDVFTLLPIVIGDAYASMSLLLAGRNFPFDRPYGSSKDELIPFYLPNKSEYDYLRRAILVSGDNSSALLLNRIIYQYTLCGTNITRQFDPRLVGHVQTTANTVLTKAKRFEKNFQSDKELLPYIDTSIEFLKIEPTTKIVKFEMDFLSLTQFLESGKNEILSANEYLSRGIKLLNMKTSFIDKYQHIFQTLSKDAIPANFFDLISSFIFDRANLSLTKDVSNNYNYPRLYCYYLLFNQGFEGLKDLIGNNGADGVKSALKMLAVQSDDVKQMGLALLLNVFSSSRRVYNLYKQAYDDESYTHQYYTTTFYKELSKFLKADYDRRYLVREAKLFLERLGKGLLVGGAQYGLSKLGKLRASDADSVSDLNTTFDQSSLLTDQAELEGNDMITDGILDA